MLKRILLIPFLCVVLAACSENDTNEDLTKTVNKNGAIESSLSIAHLNAEYDVLTTTHKIWIRENLYKTVEYHDTLPTLGVQNTTAANESNNGQASAPKDYEIYITVK